MCDFFGAIEVSTQKFILPNHLTKNDKSKQYQCIACDEPLMLKIGKVKRTHFSHFPKSTCPFSDRKSKCESEKHLNAKFKLAYYLKYKIPLKILVECPYNHTCYVKEIDIKYEDSDIVKIECSNNGFIADVAVINSLSNTIKYIFEVCHTHKTDDKTKLLRPEPWFEIDASEILDSDFSSCVSSLDNFQEVKTKEEVKLKCKREIDFKETKDDKVYRFCDTCLKLNESWVQKIPKLSKNNGYKADWKQDLPCVHCEREQYSPYFNKGYRQLCKICVYSYIDDIKDRFI